MKIWGFWATLGWAVLAFVVGQFGALGLCIWWRPGSLQTLMATPFDGAFVTVILLISNPITIAVIVFAVSRARADLSDYLAIKWPQRRDIAIGLVSLIILIALSDALLYFGGETLVTPFQLQSYNTAEAEGWLAAMLVATIVVAPAGEEVLFRGFLFRGWARSQRTVWPAIVVISLLWAALHVQYDWAGILQIFVVGLYLGWLRWRSGSMLLTFVLHALFNAEGTMETFVQLHVLAH